MMPIKKSHEDLVKIIVSFVEGIKGLLRVVGTKNVDGSDLFLSIDRMLTIKLY